MIRLNILTFNEMTLNNMC